MRRTSVEELCRLRDTCARLLTQKGVEYVGYSDLRSHLSHTAVFRRYTRVRSAFAAENIGLVHFVVRRFFSGPERPSRSDAEAYGYDDLVQEGVVGLLRAIDLFEPTVGTRFSTYSTWWIRQRVNRALENKARVVRVPVFQIERFRKLRRKKELTEEEQRFLESLSSKMNPVGISPTEHAAQNMDAELAGLRLAQRVAEALNKLGGRHAEVVRMRFGIEMDPMSLSQIGARFQISRERVRQIEKRALQELENLLEEL